MALARWSLVAADIAAGRLVRPMLPSVQQRSAWFLVAPPANFSLPKVVRFRAGSSIAAASSRRPPARRCRQSSPPSPLWRGRAGARLASAGAARGAPRADGGPTRRPARPPPARRTAPATPARGRCAARAARNPPSRSAAIPGRRTCRRGLPPRAAWRSAGESGREVQVAGRDGGQRAFPGMRGGPQQRPIAGPPQSRSDRPASVHREQADGLPAYPHDALDAKAPASSARSTGSTASNGQRLRTAIPYGSSRARILRCGYSGTAARSCCPRRGDFLHHDDVRRMRCQPPEEAPVVVIAVLDIGRHDDERRSTARGSGRRDPQAGAASAKCTIASAGRQGRGAAALQPPQRGRQQRGGGGQLQPEMREELERPADRRQPGGGGRGAQAGRAATIQRSAMREGAMLRYVSSVGRRDRLRQFGQECVDRRDALGFIERRCVSAPAAR